jgi:hypothetical protein
MPRARSVYPTIQIIRPAEVRDHDTAYHTIYCTTGPGRSPAR